MITASTRRTKLSQSGTNPPPIDNMITYTYRGLIKTGYQDLPVIWARAIARVGYFFDSPLYQSSRNDQPVHICQI
jgi:hypothetical protein